MDAGMETDTEVSLSGHPREHSAEQGLLIKRCFVCLFFTIAYYTHGFF